MDKRIRGMNGLVLETLSRRTPFTLKITKSNEWLKDAAWVGKKNELVSVLKVLEGKHLLRLAEVEEEAGRWGVGETPKKARE